MVYSSQLNTPMVSYRRRGEGGGRGREGEGQLDLCRCTTHSPMHYLTTPQDPTLLLRHTSFSRTTMAVMLGERLSTCLWSRLAANLTALLRGREGGGREMGRGGRDGEGRDGGLGPLVQLLTSPSCCLPQRTPLPPGQLAHLGWVGQGCGTLSHAQPAGTAVSSSHSETPSSMR